MTAGLADFPSQLCAPSELDLVEQRFWMTVPTGRMRATCLRLAAELYCDGYSEYELHDRIRERLPKAMREEGYGSVLLIFILATVGGAIISWCVERFLSWLFPNKQTRRPDHERMQVIYRLQAEQRAG